MQSTSPTTCIKCGTHLPAGINFRQVKDNKEQVIGARCHNACPKPKEPEVELNPLCGHDMRFLAMKVNGEEGCVNCIAQQAIDLGEQAIEEMDRFWAAMGVLSSEITVDQAIAKWKAMEGVVKAAKALRFKESEEVGHFIIHGADLAKLHMAFRHYDEQPHVQSVEEPA